MILEKLIYSKCPHCKKHGLRAIKTSFGRGYNSSISCKYCGKRFHANLGVSTITTFLVLGGLIYLRIGVLEKLLSASAGWISSLVSGGCVLIATAILYLLNYFFPLKEEE